MSDDRTNFDERRRFIWGNLVWKEVIIDQSHLENSNCEDNPKTNAFNMLLERKSYLRMLKILNCLLHSASDDITSGNLRGNSSDEH